MDAKEFKEVLNRYSAGKATAEESAFLESWYMNMGKTGQVPADETELKQAQQLIWTQFVNSHQEFSPVKRHLWLRHLSIAAAIMGLAICIYLYDISRHPGRNIVAKGLYVNDISPGKNSATLTMPNGKKIALSEAKTGVVIGDGHISYNDGSFLSSQGQSLPGGAGSKMMLTASTPRGGIYTITLSDNTKVWLNADSKLEFLPDFRNVTQRIVKLTGEAYFEVAKVMQRNVRVPFLVESKGQIVEVLGTHFNISAYQDEGVKTTLLEGSVRINKNTLLKPGEQSFLSGTSHIAITAVDVNEVVAWKNGDFIFKNETLENIMRKVARWYDVEIVYDKEVDREGRFGGEVSRGKPISEVLKRMEATGSLKFKIEGRKIHVINGDN